MPFHLAGCGVAPRGQAERQAAYQRQVDAERTELQREGSRPWKRTTRAFRTAEESFIARLEAAAARHGKTRTSILLGCSTHTLRSLVRGASLREDVHQRVAANLEELELRSA